MRWLDIGLVLFFPFPRLWIPTLSRSINTPKRTWPISSHLDRTSLVNNRYLLYGLIGDPNGKNGAILPARGYLLHPARKVAGFFSYNKSHNDQALSIKMADYWPRSVFACLWTSTLSSSINTQKKNLVNIQPS